MSPSPRNVVAVSSDALRPELLDRLLEDESNTDVIVVESIARAYLRIRQLHPDVVVLLMEIDDEDACRLLSMLHMDRALRGLNVVACTVHSHRTARYTQRDCEERPQPAVLAAC